VTIPRPTPIYRIMHIDSLAVCLQRGGLYASNTEPNDGLVYHTIHNTEIQTVRHEREIPCGHGGTVHDYVPFYFGPRSPMLYQLHTGWVEGYNEGQEPIIYLVSTVEEVVYRNLNFVFSNGHGIALFTDWFDDLQDLGEVDWDAAYAQVWRDTNNEPDRQRRKQAEFLVYQFCPLTAITEIGVVNQTIKGRIEAMMQEYQDLNIPVNIRRNWYY
jgi:hypothetical protein